MSNQVGFSHGGAHTPYKVFSTEIYIEVEKRKSFLEFRLRTRYCVWTRKKSIRMCGRGFTVIACCMWLPDPTTSGFGNALILVL